MATSRAVSSASHPILNATIRPSHKSRPFLRPFSSVPLICTSTCGAVAKWHVLHFCRAAIGTKKKSSLSCLRRGRRKSLDGNTKRGSAHALSLQGVDPSEVSYVSSERLLCSDANCFRRSGVDPPPPCGFSAMNEDVGSHEVA